ncbi:MAG: cob(I)yrinic acid a,c-diamide adenosyltransferase [Fuerstiella sp.]
MVTLNKIYTRSGDAGETGIGDGSRVSKLHQRIIAGGSIDEVNSCIGVAAAHSSEPLQHELLKRLQQKLFDLGADVSCPWDPDAEQDRCPRIEARHVRWLESEIDGVNAELSPLSSFVLPGGTVLAGFLHMARSVCRRAEIDVLRLQAEVPLNPSIAVFLNRLSDLLFVLARDANEHGQADVLWMPGTDSNG